MNNLSSALGVPDRDMLIFRLLNSYGALPASSVASRLGMNRTTAFSALRRLVERGLVFEIPKKTGCYFSAADPTELLRSAEERVEKENKRLSLLSSLANQLQKERGIEKGRPNVSFFEGENGIITLFSKTLRTDSRLDAFLTLDSIPQKVKKYLMTDYITEKKKKNVTSRVLISESIRAMKYKTLDIEGGRETRFVPKNTQFEAEIIIGGSIVALIDFDLLVGVLVESESISNTLRSAFEILWKSQS